MSTVQCPQCDRRFKIPPQLVGKAVRCPNCSATIPPTSSPPVAMERPTPARASARVDEIEKSMSRPTTIVDPEELIDMTAMVDIVFFLLIFFLVTSMAGIHSSAKMPRPESHGEETGSMAHGNEDPRNDPKAIVVTIKKDDTIEIEGVPFHDMGDFVARLRQLRNTGGMGTSMLVLGHGDASHGTAVAVLDAGYEVGIDQLRMAVPGDASE